MQIQHPFGGLPLSILAKLGLGCYSLLSDFRQRCLLCGATGCAVRHGLYYRRVVDRGGLVIARFPVPRFRCRGKGAFRPLRGRTFSVLPASLVPRRRLSLELMLQIVHSVCSGRSISGVLDDLARVDHSGSGALLMDEAALYRILALFAAVSRRLAGSPGTSAGRERRPRILRRFPPDFQVLFSSEPRAPTGTLPGLSCSHPGYPLLLFDIRALAGPLRRDHHTPC